MRRVISILTAIIIIIATASAFAEGTTMEGDFSIRSGIKFGMSINEVRGIETNSAGETSTKDSATMGTITQLGYHADSIAGVPCSGKSTTLNYCFNSTGKLEAIHYWYGYYNRNSASSYYKEIYNLMCEKYGTPLFNDDGGLFDICSPAFDNYFLSKAYGGKNTIPAYSEWLVEYDDTWVVIDVVLHDMKVKSGDYEFSVGYRSISKENMAKMVGDAANAAAEKKQEQNSDI